MIALDPQVHRALAELGLGAVPGDDAATGWLVATSPALRHAADSYERVAIRRLALALVAGDLAAAHEASRWITDPAGAMRAALDAERVFDREVRA